MYILLYKHLSQAAHWGLNLLEIKPIKSFWWITKNYGYPLFSRKGHADASKNCCRYLKEYPLERVLRKEKYDLYMTGLTRHESRRREFSAQKHGIYSYPYAMAKSSSYLRTILIFGQYYLRKVLERRFTS